MTPDQIQAASAVVTTVVTVVLAVIAWRALSESARQARAASDALDETRRVLDEMRQQRTEMERQREEMRRQTLFASLPILYVYQPWGDLAGEQLDLHTTVRIENPSSTPALDLRIEFREDKGDEVGDHLYAQGRRPMLRPGGDEQIAIPSQDLLNLDILTSGAAQAAQARDERPEWYFLERIALLVTCRTALGVDIMQQWRWYTKSASQDQEIVWQLRLLRIAAGDDDPDPIVLKARD